MFVPCKNVIRTSVFDNSQGTNWHRNYKYGKNTNNGNCGKCLKGEREGNMTSSETDIGEENAKYIGNQNFHADQERGVKQDKNKRGETSCNKGRLKSRGKLWPFAAWNTLSTPTSASQS